MKHTDAHQTIDPSTGLTTPQTLALEDAVQRLGNCRPKTRYKRLVEGLEKVYIDYGVVMSNQHARTKIEEIAWVKGLSKMDVSDAYATIGEEVDRLTRIKVKAKNYSKPDLNDEERRIQQSIEKFEVFTDKGKRLPMPWGKVFLDIHPSLFFYKSPSSTKESSHKWLYWHQDGYRWLRIDADQVRMWILQMLEVDGMTDMNQCEKLVGNTYKNICRNARPGRNSEVGDREFYTTHDLDLDEEIICDNMGYGLSLKTCGLSRCSINHPISLRLATIYDPDADCPLWRKCIWIWSGQRDAVTKKEKWEAIQRAAFLQFMAGYVLLPHNNDHLLFFFQGRAGQGKSTFLDTLMEVMGKDFAIPVQSDQFVKSRGQRAVDPMIVIGAMRNVRLAVLSDLGSSGQWNAAQLKSLTGEAYQQTRKLYEDPTTSKRRVTCIAQGNNKMDPGPGVEGLKRRVRLVNLPSVIKEKDKDAKILDKLKAELPGILNWSLKGLRFYNRHGDYCPPFIARDTEAYLNDYGPIVRRFIADQMDCSGEIGKQVSVAEVYNRFIEWRIAEGYAESSETVPKTYTKAAFRKILMENHLKVEKSTGMKGKQYYVIGCDLKEPDEMILRVRAEIAAREEKWKQTLGGQAALEAAESPPPKGFEPEPESMAAGDGDRDF